MTPEHTTRHSRRSLPRSATSICAAGMFAVVAAAGCRPSHVTVHGSVLTSAQQHAIADTLTGLIASAYDFGHRQGVVDRLMHLYPEVGPVVSASNGQITTSRDSLQAVIRRFWETTGVNMQDPHWEWGDVYVDVLAPDAAVMTATYRIPHRTPTGAPHVIAGAWTAVWVRDGARWEIIQEHLSDLPAPHAMSGEADTATHHPATR
jgi:ketosteroid isomerase-like protein